jgi:hypothetical protein
MMPMSMGDLTDAMGSNLSPEARFDFLLSLPESADIGAKVNAATFTTKTGFVPAWREGWSKLLC